jgi:hypothetical protein
VRSEKLGKVYMQIKLINTQSFKFLTIPSGYLKDGVEKPIYRTIAFNKLGLSQRVRARYNGAFKLKYNRWIRKESMPSELSHVVDTLVSIFIGTIGYAGTLLSGHATEPANLSQIGLSISYVVIAASIVGFLLSIAALLDKKQ